MTHEEEQAKEQKPEAHKTRKGKARRRGQGEGSIYQRKDGRWVAEITLENGKRKPFYGKTRKEVAEKLQKALYEQKQGTLLMQRDQKLETYLHRWLEDVHKPSVRVSTYVKSRVLVRKHIVPALGHLKLQKLTSQQVQTFYAQKLQERLSTSMVRAMHRLLHKALENAVGWGLVARNVCARNLVTPPQLRKLETPLLTKEQARRLLEVAKGHRLEGFLTLALATGMRHGELAALRWEDINFEEGSLQVRRTMSRVAGYKNVEREPKTAKGRRKIMLPHFVREVLKQHGKQQAEERLQMGASWQEQGLVFCNMHGGFLRHQTVMRQFRQLLEQAGLPAMRIHDLRHSAATIFLEMGVHPKLVQELLGHSNISITMDLYSHALPSMQRGMMDDLDNFFGK